MNKIFLDQLQKLKKDSTRCKKKFSNQRVDLKSDIFHIESEKIYLDYSRNILDQNTLANLTRLAKILNIKEKFKDLCSGNICNISENRKVLHPAMRDTFFDLDENTKKEIKQHKKKLKKLSEDINSGKFKSFSGKKYRNIVSIGIGGSYFGTKMVYEALKNFSTSDINLFFLSNLDVTEADELLSNLNKDTTLFILVSKSFKTPETLENARKVKSWLKKGNVNKNIMKSFIAVTDNYQEALKFGIHEDLIINLWDWLGGRYSIWSGVSLGLIIAIGYKNFSRFLRGANLGDKHFYSKGYSENIPVIMALLTFYYTRFFGAQTHLILPYNYRLRFFVDHIQQVEMESNGKSIEQNGKKFSHLSSNIIWGSNGICSQHSYYQLLYQGNTFIPADFIFSKKNESGTKDNQDKVFSNFLSHVETRNRGFTKKEAEDLYHEKFSSSGLEKNLIIKNLMIKGNKPTNALLLKDLSPETVGMLISFYEHKTYVLGLISNIDSFDQWAVEIGKITAEDIYKSIKSSKKSHNSKNSLLKKYLDKKF